MEREVSSAITLAVTLAAIGLLLSIVWFTVYIGTDMKNLGAGALNSVQDNMSNGYIESLASGEVDNDMPAATAYNLLKTYDKVIIESANMMTGKVTNLMTGDSDLRSDLSGRVQLELHKTDSGAFVVLIHNGSPRPQRDASGNVMKDTMGNPIMMPICDWRAGGCIEPNGNTPEIADFKARYNLH